MASSKHCLLRCEPSVPKQQMLTTKHAPDVQVTEAEMRYCYARLLSVGNPSGPVKFSGQPQYDSEQVVSPLFTFSAPPMEEGGEEGGSAEGSGEAAKQVAGMNQLAMVKPSTQPKAPVSTGLRAPTAALYETQEKTSSPTRAGAAS